MCINNKAECDATAVVSTYFSTALRSTSWTLGTRVAPPTKITCSISFYRQKTMWKRCKNARLQAYIHTNKCTSKRGSVVR